jgi:hypothetical protein
VRFIRLHPNGYLSADAGVFTQSGRIEDAPLRLVASASVLPGSFMIEFNVEGNVYAKSMSSGTTDLSIDPLVVQPRNSARTDSHRTRRRSSRRWNRHPQRSPGSRLRLRRTRRYRTQIRFPSLSAPYLRRRWQVSHRGISAPSLHSVRQPELSSRSISTTPPNLATGARPARTWASRPENQRKWSSPRPITRAALKPVFGGHAPHWEYHHPARPPR